MVRERAARKAFTRRNFNGMEASSLNVLIDGLGIGLTR
jgi:hypothetical protein